MDTRDFLVPDNYADFHCKCGKCRHTCCDGWAVTFPREDYFRLLSVTCSPELRRKLDTSLHLADDPTPERYAELLPNWEGHCPLQRADGLCALQAECGEDAISSTCRYYPRGIRTMDDDECSCSASCERVVEMLLHRLPPMTFRRMRLSFAMPLPPRETDAALTAETRQLRRDVVTMLQAREVPLASRMMGIRAALVLEESGRQTSESRWAAFRAAAKVAIPPADWALRANILRTLMEELLADTISMGRNRGGNPAAPARGTGGRSFAAGGGHVSGGYAGLDDWHGAADGQPCVLRGLPVRRASGAPGDGSGFAVRGVRGAARYGGALPSAASG